MKRTIRTILALSALLILSAIVISTINSTTESTAPTIEVQPNNIYEETLIITADKNFDPYSFTDETGANSGHDIEMIYLLADAMEMNVEIRLMEWNEAIEATKTGKTDAILGLVYTPQPIENLHYSIPICNDSFVVFGNKGYAGLNDLYDKKIAILKGSDSYKLIIKPYALEENTTEYSTYEEAFDSVENGETEYVIATYSVGRRISTQYNDINAYGTPLVNNSFCIATTDVELMNKINASILDAKSDGTLEYLSEKWLGKYVEIISIDDFFKQHMIFLISLASFIVLIPSMSLIYVYRKRSILYKYRETLLLERVSKDYLTNLLNRSGAESMITQTLEETQEGVQHALFMIDIDEFKAVNDTHGHAFGDQVLIMISTELEKIFQEGSIVARMGGDEFLVLVKDFKHISDVEIEANKTCATLYKEKIIQSTPIRVSASVGISIFPRNGKDFISLYKSADKALYKAKEKGKNRFYTYEGD